MFCFPNSLKSNKPRKTRNNEINQNNNKSNNKSNTDSINNGENHTHATDMIDIIRCVTDNFSAIADDELSVSPGDVVVYQYSVPDSGKDWAFVKCLSTKKEGFVPSEILSTSRPNPQFKKKMPRTPHFHRAHHASDQPSSNGDDLRLPHHHGRSQQARFELPHSLQGSSSKLSFQKIHNLRHYNPPAYYNVCSSDPHYETQFRLQDFGYYMVTHNFVAREENDLEVRPGDYVTVLNKDDKHWYWVQRQDGAEGFVPSTFICNYEQVQTILNKGNSTVTMKSSNLNDCHTYINHRPVSGSLATDQSFICPNL